jgi:hypothetical protein
MNVSLIVNILDDINQLQAQAKDGLEWKFSILLEKDFPNILTVSWHD